MVSSSTAQWSGTCAPGWIADPPHRLLNPSSESIRPTVAWHHELHDDRLSFRPSTCLQVRLGEVVSYKQKRLP